MAGITVALALGGVGPAGADAAAGAAGREVPAAAPKHLSAAQGPHAAPALRSAPKHL